MTQIPQIDTSSSFPLIQYQEADAHLEAGSGNALRPTLMRAQLALEAGGGAAGMAKALEILSNLPPSPEGEDIANSGAVLASRLALHQQVAFGCFLSLAPPFFSSADLCHNANDQHL